MAAEFPEWTGGDPASSAWNEIILGGIRLPGIWEVENLEVGIEVKIKKAKGIDKPTSTDCGLDPANMEISGQLTTYQWAEFQEGLPTWNPRRPGRERGPTPIIHPLINLYGIKDVRITKIKTESPKSKSGMKVTIFLQEWFDAPVETKSKNKSEKFLKWEEVGKKTIQYIDVQPRNTGTATTENPTVNPGNPLTRVVHNVQSLFN